MSATPKLAQPCPWILHKSKLGEGGNGMVYEGHHPDNPDSSVAIKVLEHANKKSHKRFRYEVEAHKIIGSHTGVLPVIDANIPPYGGEELPWMVMPIATPIRKALGKTPSLEIVVSAISDIASTLANLKEKHGISHRDIKPENLYSYEGRYVLGDLGLVSFPGKEVLTLPGDRVGAANFQAPETLNNSDTAKGEPADVHALAKTLWVLAKPWVNGKPERMPQPGPQRRDYPTMRLGTYVKHPRIVPLEILLERATHPVPDERPTLVEMRDEMREWLIQPQASSPIPELSGFQEAFNLLTDLDRRQRYNAVARMETIERIKHLIQERFGPIKQSLPHIEGQYVRPSSGMPMGDLFYNIDPLYPKEQPTITHQGESMRIDGPLLQGNAYVNLTCILEMVALQSEDDYIVAALLISDPFEDRPQGQWASVLWMDSAVVRRGSAKEENAIDQTARQLLAHLPGALQTFLQRVELRIETHGEGANY